MDLRRMALLIAALFISLINCGHVGGDDEAPIPTDEPYDYIIVGAGIGGLVMANRLTQDPRVSVLLIEAGELDDRSQNVTVPGEIGLGDLRRYGWNMTTTSQASLDNRTISFGQGRVVGGSTILNGLCWTRGSRADFDAWEALGNPAWGWDGLLPYFLKAEKFIMNANDSMKQALHIQPDFSSHGQNGAVQVGYPRYFYNQSQNFLEGVHKLGIPYSGDLNAGVATGAGIIPSSLSADNQSRFDARTAYLDPALSRRNLHLLTGHTVTRVLYRRYADSPYRPSIVVTGVEFARNSTGPRRTVLCNKEVILSAGAIFSPMLLQVSGFGPSELLQELGIGIAVDLPGVGQNFQDHPMIQLDYDYNSTEITTSKKINGNDTLLSAALDEFTQNRTGPWTAPMVNTVAFSAMQWAMNLTTPCSEQQQQQQHLRRATPNASLFLPASYDETLRAGYAAQEAILDSLLASDKSPAFEIMETSWGQLSVSSMQPYSRGTVRASSRDILNNDNNNNNAAVIDPRFLSHPVDAEVLALALQVTAQLVETPSMAALGPTAPVGFGRDELRNATARHERIRERVGTEFHPCGTTAMMPRNKGGVVDPSLKVYGTRNLRVVDAGVMPMIPGAHIQAAIYAVAEKAADIVRMEGLMNPGGSSPAVGPMGPFGSQRQGV